MGRYRLQMNNKGKYELVDTAEKEYGRRIRLNWMNEMYRKGDAKKLDDAIKAKNAKRIKAVNKASKMLKAGFAPDGVWRRGSIIADIGEGSKMVGKEATGKSNPTRQEIIDAYAERRNIKKPQGYDIKENTEEMRKHEENRVQYHSHDYPVNNKNDEILNSLNEGKNPFVHNRVDKYTTQSSIKFQTGLEAVNEAEEEFEQDYDEVGVTNPLKTALDRDRRDMKLSKGQFDFEKEADFADEMFDKLNSVDPGYVRSSAQFRALKNSLNEYRQLCDALYQQNDDPTEAYYHAVEKSYNNFVKQANDYFEYKSNPKNCSGSKLEKSRIACVKEILETINERHADVRSVNIFEGADKVCKAVNLSEKAPETAFEKTQATLKQSMLQSYTNLYEMSSKESLTAQEKLQAKEDIVGIIAKQDAIGELDKALNSYKTAIAENKVPNVKLSKFWEHKNGNIEFNEAAFSEKNIKDIDENNITPELVGTFLKKGSPAKIMEAMQKSSENQPEVESISKDDKIIEAPQNKIPGLS